MWWSGRPRSRAGLARAMMPSSGAGFPFWDKAHLTYKIFSSKSTHFWRRLGGLGEYARSYSACCKSSSSSSEQLGQVAKWAGALVLGTVRAKFLMIIKKFRGQKELFIHMYLESSTITFFAKFGSRCDGQPFMNWKPHSFKLSLFCVKKSSNHSIILV